MACSALPEFLWQANCIQHLFTSDWAVETNAIPKLRMLHPQLQIWHLRAKSCWPFYPMALQCFWRSWEAAFNWSAEGQKKKQIHSSSCETGSKWMSFHDYFIGRPAWRSCRAHLSQTHSFQSAIACDNPTTFPPDFARVNEGRTPCEGFFCCFPWLNLWLSQSMHMEISYAAFLRDPHSFHGSWGSTVPSAKWRPSMATSIGGGDPGKASWQAKQKALLPHC